MTPGGDLPSLRTLAAMTNDSANDRLLLFGGRTVTGTLLADLWAFDLDAGTWQQLDDGGGDGPSARMAHSLTYDPDTGNAILVGGVADAGGDTLLNDTWHYREETGWGDADPATALPPVAYHRAVYGDGAILLFSNGEVWQYE